MSNRGIPLKLVTALAVATAVGTTPGCGRVKHGLDQAVESITTITPGHAGGHGPGAPTPTPPTPPTTGPIVVDTDVESWANHALGGLKLAPANGTTAQPPDSCSTYYNSVLAYAEAMQAMYIKRYLAWARYQIAVGGFVTPIGYGPYGPVGYGVPGGAVFNGGEGVETASAGAAGGSNAGAPSAPTADTTASAPASAPASNGSAGNTPAAGTVASEYQTNNQVTGVDETDYTKSDGKYVYVASGQTLRVFDLTGKIVYAAPIVGGESPQGLQLSNGRLLLITQGTAANPYLSPAIAVAESDPNYWWSYWSWYRQNLWWYQNVTMVHEFQTNPDGTLTETKERKYWGSFQDGREINGTVHLVMQKQLPWEILGTGLDLTVQPAFAGITNEATLLAYVQHIAQDNLNDWQNFLFNSGDVWQEFSGAYKSGHCQAFGQLTSTTADEIDGQKLLTAYQAWDNYLVYGQGIDVSVYSSYPIFPTYDQVTTVASLDMTDTNPDAVGTVISPVSPNMIYASSNELVTGNARYQWFNYWQELFVLPAYGTVAGSCFADPAVCAEFGVAPAPGIEVVSVIPAASITQNTNFFDFLTFNLSSSGAVPTGIGTLPGAPINNYAINAGATTLQFVVNQSQETDTVEPFGYESSSSQNTSALTVMQATNGQWSPVTTLPLNVGGYVSGVRFIGNAAFVSLSDPSQPLYAVDLSNETAPKLAGAMPAEMSATYFQDMGDGKTILSLGTGQAGPAAAGVYQGDALQVAMIDVSNLAAPTVLGRATLDVGGSQAQYDFKSFRFVPRLGLIVLPMTWPARLELLAADRTKGFAHFGTIDLEAQYYAGFGWNGDPRTMLFDDLLVGVFGDQDMGAQLNYATVAPQLTYSPSLELVYELETISGWPTYWTLKGANEITPLWMSGFTQEIATPAFTASPL